MLLVNHDGTWRAQPPFRRRDKSAASAADSDVDPDVDMLRDTLPDTRSMSSGLASLTRSLLRLIDAELMMLSSSTNGRSRCCAMYDPNSTARATPACSVGSYDSRMPVRASTSLRPISASFQYHTFGWHVTPQWQKTVSIVQQRAHSLGKQKLYRPG